MKLKSSLTAAICFLILLCSLISHAQVKNRHIDEVPFEFHKNLIFVEVRINGKGPLNMMLDTGTDPSAIDLTTAKQLSLKLKATGQKAAGGGTGSNEVYDVAPVSVAVGKLKAKNVEISGVDLSAISKAWANRCTAYSDIAF